jgi:hypothetical protein
MPICEYNNCLTESSYNYKDLPRKYCYKHKLENMINVKDKLCIYENCIKAAYFNYKNETEKLYCNIHKLDNMVNVKSNICIFNCCNKQPTFNYKNSLKAVYCFEHKEELMVDIKHKTCIFSNCNNRAYYNYINKKPIYCYEHKLENMLNLDSKKCLHEDCYTSPCFNYKNKKRGIYCSEHKLNEMVDVNNVKSKCKFNGCNKNASFNYENKKTVAYCYKHKLKDMINITLIKCKTPLCDITGNKKYEGYCMRCYMYTYPDKKLLKNYKTKEQTVLDYIKNEFPNLTISSDKINVDGCSKKRPDILIDLGYQIIIIEIDEKQHKNYETICENKRLMEISQDNNHRPIIFIRFNPDSYINDGGKVSSCWKLLKSGILSIDKKKEKEWNNRLLTLKNTINYWCDPNNILTKTIEVIYLFYDNYKN